MKIVFKTFPAFIETKHRNFNHWVLDSFEFWLLFYWWSVTHGNRQMHSNFSDIFLFSIRQCIQLHKFCMHSKLRIWMKLLIAIPQKVTKVCCVNRNKKKIFSWQAKRPAKSHYFFMLSRLKNTHCEFSSHSFCIIFMLGEKKKFLFFLFWGDKRNCFSFFGFSHSEHFVNMHKINLKRV